MRLVRDSAALEMPEIHTVVRHGRQGNVGFRNSPFMRDCRRVMGNTYGFVTVTTSILLVLNQLPIPVYLQG